MGYHFLARLYDMTKIMGCHSCDYYFMVYEISIFTYCESPVDKAYSLVSTAYEGQSHDRELGVTSRKEPVRSRGRHGYSCEERMAMSCEDLVKPCLDS